MKFNYIHIQKGGNNHEITKEKFTPPVKRRGNGKSLRFWWKVGGGGDGPTDSQHGHFGECLPLLAPEDGLCICPLFVSISD